METVVPDFVKMFQGLLGLGSTPIGMIFAGLCLVVVVFGYFWLRGAMVEAAKKESEKQANKDQSSNKSDNQKIEDEWKKAHNSLEGK